ncbi:MAG: hypothetical protein KatS3mg116_2566 [Elioraea sp.]|nr:MAG: hypothetical protein KatS3mg116_2566 [Elioraea sp.]
MLDVVPSLGLTAAITALTRRSGGAIGHACDLHRLPQGALSPPAA